jgi:hypothetical protein
MALGGSHSSGEHPFDPPRPAAAPSRASNRAHHAAPSTRRSARSRHPPPARRPARRNRPPLKAGTIQTALAELEAAGLAEGTDAPNGRARYWSPTTPADDRAAADDASDDGEDED